MKLPAGTGFFMILLLLGDRESVGMQYLVQRSIYNAHRKNPGFIHRVKIVLKQKLTRHLEFQSIH